MKSTLFLLITTVVAFSFAGTPSTSPQYTEANKDDSIRDAVFGELLGNGILVSVNCEKFVTRDFGVRIGIGAVTGEDVTVPLLCNYYYGQRYRLELGLGFVYLPRWKSGLSIGKEGSAFLSSTVGLRFQPEEGGVLIRLSFTPFHDLAHNRFHLYGGISLGLAL
ncbi:MAG: hypothetical protein HY961_16310 [Ignavibacteriae bacterium]|nr:hypothetical protein [Ignavibacteriota bacterium]